MPKIIRISTIPLSLNLFCKGLLRELSDDYTVIAISSPGPLLDEIKQREGVQTIPVQMNRSISLLADLKAICKLIRIFRAERPDVVHSMTPKAGLLAMIAAKVARVPIRIHSFTGLLWPTAHGLYRIIFKLSDYVTCACATHPLPEGQGVMNDLTQGGIHKPQMQILGNGNMRGIDLDYYTNSPNILEHARQLRSSFNINGNDFVWLFVGRLVPDKGISELIQAFNKIKSHFPSTHLLLCGETEDTEPLPQNILQELRNNTSIHLSPGWVSDVRPYYAASNALAFPSYREGFPNVVLEAGAMELPAIVTDINGSREIITDGENGYIVPTHDVEKLQDAMSDIMTNVNHSKDMGIKARMNVAHRFDQTYIRKCLKDFYCSVLKTMRHS